MRILIKISLFGFFILAVFLSCREETLTQRYKTENVIIIVIDGPRYSETWGDSTHKYIPRLSNHLSKLGVINTQFYNNGPTYTLAGHASITTGLYQEIDNTGKELPIYPSFFQYWNKKFFYNNLSSWIITSKDKHEVLSNCKHTKWIDKYRPSANCGINGLGSGSRHDSVTLNKVIQVLSEHHPNLVLVNFREPDYSAHSHNWDNYLQGIMSTDEYAYKIWEYCQNNLYYKGKTTMFITNDHGRHLDSIADGFVSHGDYCSGCSHINFYAYGPDFKRGVIVETKRELIDIIPTIAELLQFEIENIDGQIMYELFNKAYSNGKASSSRSR